MSETHNPLVNAHALLCGTAMLQAIAAFLKSMGLTAKDLMNKPELVDLIVAYHFVPGERRELLLIPMTTLLWPAEHPPHVQAG